MPTHRPSRAAAVAALTVPKADDPAVDRIVRPIVEAIRDLQRRLVLLEQVPDAVSTVTASPLFDKVLTPAQITGTTNNWNPGVFSAGVTLVRATSDATRLVNGMVGGVDRIVVCLLNVNAIGSNAPTWVHEDAGSLAANRFHNSGGLSKNGQSSGAVWYLYDGASSRWLNIMDTQ